MSYQRGQKQRVCHNICVIRKPRRWYGAKDEDSPRRNFRGLIVSEEKYFLCDMVTIDAPTIVYAIDGHKMELETSYQEYVYRELHGVVGEGKGQFFQGLPIHLCLLDSHDTMAILNHLQIPRLFPSTSHWCPYYAGPVIFAVSTFNEGNIDEQTLLEERKEMMARGLKFCLEHPLSRPHWIVSEDMLLCALQDEEKLQPFVLFHSSCKLAKRTLG